MLNLSVNIDFVESIFICARLGTISLDVLHCDEWAEHQQYRLSSGVIALVNSFAELALSALSALCE
jgi:hypothetical protein